MSAGAQVMDAIQPRTIFYVEDDAVTLTAYRNRLQQARFRVVTAADGLEAMKLLSQQTPDLVLLDLMLPRFNGVEVLKFIRTQPRLKTIPVITLSTNSIIDVAQEFVLETANKRLIKDQCTFPIMLQAIYELLTPVPVEADGVAPVEPPRNGVIPNGHTWLAEPLLPR